MMKKETIITIYIYIHTYIHTYIYIYIYAYIFKANKTYKKKDFCLLG